MNERSDVIDISHIWGSVNSKSQGGLSGQPVTPRRRRCSPGPPQPGLQQHLAWREQVLTADEIDRMFLSRIEGATVTGMFSARIEQANQTGYYTLDTEGVIDAMVPRVDVATLGMDPNDIEANEDAALAL